MAKIKDMNNQELENEFKIMDSMINETDCFGTEDLIYYYSLADEMVERGIEHWCLK